MTQIIIRSNNIVTTIHLGTSSGLSEWRSFTTVASYDVPSLTLVMGERYEAQIPPLEPNVKNAVYIVHGWNSSSEEQWVTDMQTAIKNKIADNVVLNENEWEVYTVDWEDLARGYLVEDRSIIDLIIAGALNKVTNFEFFPALENWAEELLLNLLPDEQGVEGIPQRAYANARLVGKKLGAFISEKNLDYIHFIAHSAGGNVIETAAETIKQNNGDSPIIHSTFLDAYDPSGSSSRYGNSADWAEQYVDMRPLGALFIDDLYDTTDTLLKHSFDFDVTIADDRELPDDIIERQTLEHRWPCIYYLESIDNILPINPLPLGYSLALASGNFNNYPLHWLELIGSKYPKDDSVIIENSFSNIELDNSNITASSTGEVTIQIDDTTNKIILATGSPVWCSIEFDSSNSANYLKFDYQFISSSEGLLSVIFDNQVVYKADERYEPKTLVGKDHIWIGNVEPGTHTIGFRLDTFSEDQSLIELSNMQIGTKSFVLPEDHDDDGDGFTENEGDCNDQNESIYPMATEIPYDGIDQDCDGSDLIDVDGDGFSAVVAGGTDCNDSDPSINPDAKEICDGLDNNCNGAVDDGVIVFSEFEEPINADGSSIFKIKRTVPVKLSVSDCSGNNVDDATLAISIQKLTDQVLGTYEEVAVEDAGLANDNGIYFRYSETDLHYIYNWSTKGLSAGTYRIKATAETGDFTFVSVSLK